MAALSSFQLSLTKFTYSVILLIFITYRYGLAGLSYWFGSKYVHLNVISHLNLYATYSFSLLSLIYSSLHYHYYHFTSA